jgi:hypothetical protein
MVVMNNAVKLSVFMRGINKRHPSTRALQKRDLESYTHRRRGESGLHPLNITPSSGPARAKHDVLLVRTTHHITWESGLVHGPQPAPPGTAQHSTT